MSLNSWNSPLNGPLSPSPSSSSSLTLGGGGPRGRGVAPGDGLKPFGRGGEGVDVEPGVPERFRNRSLSCFRLWNKGALANLAGIGGWLVFCGGGGGGGLSFTGAPFGFGLLAVEDSAGD